ncbi:MAG: hypothetical protein ACLQPD_19130 [Desulfomonilaceae bacterium]
MKQIIREQHVWKVFVGFLVEEGLGKQLKDAAWRRRTTLSELLREYCRAGLRGETNAKNLRRGRKENRELFDSHENQAPVQED